MKHINWKGSILEFLSEDFKNDKEIIFEAIDSDFEAYKFASENLKKNFQFNLKVSKINGAVI